MIDFSRTEEQEQFVETAREFGREVLQPAEVAMDANPDPEAAFNSDIYWNTLAKAFELGFHKMSLPESHGGLGLDPVSTGIVWEELARWGTGFTAGLMAASVVPQLVGFAAGHNKKMMERFVAPFCEDTTGKLVTAWGSSEPDVGSDGKNYHDPSVYHRTSAQMKDGRWVINGTKSNFVSNGGVADAYIVFACIERKNGLLGSGTFVVPADTPGVTRGKAVDRVGLRALNQAPVYFDDVEIPEENLIFPPGPGYPMLHRTIITVGNLGTGYLALGLLRAAYEDALEYARERVQWGKPIAEHQLVAKRLFEINSAILSMRALLYQGSWHCKSQFPGNLINSVSAKITASKLARKHTAEMVQVLGGYGISKDYRLEKYMRDAPLLEIMDGTNDTLMMELIPKLQPY